MLRGVRPFQTLKQMPENRTHTSPAYLSRNASRSSVRPTPDALNNNNVDRSIDRSSRLYLTEVAVRSDCRRRGVGRVLLGLVDDVAEELKTSEVGEARFRSGVFGSGQPRPWCWFCRCVRACLASLLDRVVSLCMDRLFWLLSADFSVRNPAVDSFPLESALPFTLFLFLDGVGGAFFLFVCCLVGRFSTAGCKKRDRFQRVVCFPDLCSLDGGDSRRNKALCVCPPRLPLWWLSDANEKTPKVFLFCRTGVLARKRDQRGGLAALRELRLRRSSGQRLQPGLHQQPRPFGRLHRAATSSPSQDVPERRRKRQQQRLAAVENGGATGVHGPSALYS